MPAPNTDFRTLKAEFRLFFDRERGWPLWKQVKAALSHRGGGRQKSYFDMKDGKAVPEKFVRALVERLWEEPLLAEYLAAQGVTDRAGLNADQVVDRVAEPAEGPPASPIRDWYADGLDIVATLKELIFGNIKLSERSFCRTEDDVRKAASMIFRSSGRVFGRDRGLSLTDDEAVAFAERSIRTSLGRYAERVVGLWRAEPMTVLFTVVDNRRVACGIMLPLRDEFYDDVRTGRRVIHDWTAEIVTRPSQSLIIEAVGELSDDEFPDGRRRAAQLMRNFYLQTAYLSRPAAADPPHVDLPVRLLSLCGTPLYAHRLKKAGYHPTGYRMNGFEVEIYEMLEKESWPTLFCLGDLRRKLTPEMMEWIARSARPQ